MDCEGFMASIAHNLLKAIRRLAPNTGPPGRSDSDGYAHSPLSESPASVVIAPA